MMQSSETDKKAGFVAPSLPSGGGAMSGLKGDLVAAGPDGAATLTLPLPLSAGRGYAPAMGLTYHSRAGNGPFGMGWNISTPAVRRRTNKGVPAYDGTDEFIGPEGGVQIPVLAADGAANVRCASTLLEVNLQINYIVRAYRSRVESDFSYMEYWVPEAGLGQDFWVRYSPDGQIHLFGRNPQARISNPDNPAQTAVWLAESSVSLTGEQIYWQYRAEDDTNCSDAEKSTHSAVTGQRYLTAVWYGNRKAGRTLQGLTAAPVAEDWLFVLVLDYGERKMAPDWLSPASGSWPCRQDCFSSWEYGFEVRTRRLCHQVLMYHAVTALAGKAQAGDVPQLVACLQLTYQEAPSYATLRQAQQLAYEQDGTLLALPPLVYGWQVPALPETLKWQPRQDMENFNLKQSYQMVDLHGEGLAGILYQDQGAWWYRAPIRQPDAGDNAVTWGAPTPLPIIPSHHESGMLADLNGDGYLEWVVTLPGVGGYYERTPECAWQHFTPLSALPTEYAHPRAQLANITGSGLTDLVLIGPKSVRLYSGTGDGWQAGQTIMQEDGITLPVHGTDASVLVAFSDMTGSGQQHLVEVRATGLRYWPNIGNGKFGSPIMMPGFCPATEFPAEQFNPTRLYLADTDGSGTTDLIYACSTRLQIYRNLSGNAFAKPFSVLLPEGIDYDNTCSLQLADIQGLGVASMLLTVPHLCPRHWICHLSASKPGLLNTMNNRMGANHTLYYRSSVQFWLDEKAKKPGATNYLPFPMHTLQRTEITDEITGNRLYSSICYRHGVWDRAEREFRGFGFVELHDTDTSLSQEKGTSVSRQWYATGLPEVDNRLAEEYWQGNPRAFTGFTPRFTIGSGEDEKAYTPQDKTTFWLNRGLKGLLLRSELYGMDGSSQQDIPYTVTENRPQVRLVQAGALPVVWPMVVESRSAVYERISSDPQCAQQILLTSDEYGQPLRQVSINYPRARPQAGENPYPDTLPATLFAASFDEQQCILRLALQQHCWHTLGDITKGIWIIGLADASRRDVFSYSDTTVPENGLTLELLQKKDGLLADSQHAVLTGQQKVWYWDETQQRATDKSFTLPPRLAFTDSAVLDEETINTLSAHLSAEHLQQAGYLPSSYLFARPGEQGRKLWVARHGITTYASARHFHLAETYRVTFLTGKSTVTRDAYDCVIILLEDAAALTVTADYDWRFLTAVRVTDANDNVQAATLDALGRITRLRRWGTERGERTGYSDAPLQIPTKADDALRLNAPLPAVQCLVYVADSWMQTETEKLPPHVVILTTDRYDNDPAQQIRQQVVFSDGFGQVLQTAVRQADGEAWQRNDNGSLAAVSTENKLAIVKTAFRWAISGRTEYDSKGRPIRAYQPYFLDSWKYVSDDSARRDLFADIHYYDPIGREYQVITAKGGLRRRQFTPWFVVSEDENDTATQSGYCV